MLPEELGTSVPSRRFEWRLIIVFISIRLFGFPLFCLLSLSFALKAADVTTADSCFFLPLRIEESLRDFTTGTGDNSSKNVDVDEGAGESRRTGSPPFRAGTSSYSKTSSASTPGLYG
ncbi:hypothetical protein L798_13420 [Zootermopsis nevadensis]|uniref:Transmembrane protein n=1 Tax=Zootermopsis nevadensis TaxID=136037 RepID=A0A067RIU2_ZOONE|nr:hypothetical protein L798_13420 [Zootermopsis nevadensis]